MAYVVIVISHIENSTYIVRSNLGIEEWCYREEQRPQVPSVREPEAEREQGGVVQRRGGLSGRIGRVLLLLQEEIALESLRPCQGRDFPTPFLPLDLLSISKMFWFGRPSHGQIYYTLSTYMYHQEHIRRNDSLFSKLASILRRQLKI